ncbi:hypothetical protein FRB94_006235 [Tulasnella sp. JGI-2019a]|nr:hypothetical protein FRB94_006235 [Tulasnella sp. JGI-2019a]KAG9016477.1 hypothetical protein FRB93_010726 [Tulasnella sp. JGI-2019a]
MQHIEPSSLSSLPERIAYLKAFLDFTAGDANALHAAKPVVAPLIPTILDAVYIKLLSFDITAQYFAVRNTGFEGTTPAKTEEPSLDHPQIAFRKTFLQKYLVTLVTADYDDEKTWEYLDKVAIMHTGQPGFAHRKNKPELRVDYMHMAALLGYVVDVVLGAVIEHPDLDGPTKSAILRALNKVIWIQNDLFARHYMPDSYNPTSALAPLSNTNQWVVYGLKAIALTGVTTAILMFT